MTAKRPPLTGPQRRARDATYEPPPARLPGRDPCTLCGATWLDYPAGRDAHQIVFGHPPEAAGRGVQCEPSDSARPGRPSDAGPH